MQDPRVTNGRMVTPPAPHIDRARAPGPLEPAG
jgi:hypothetical protein